MTGRAWLILGIGLLLPVAVCGGDQFNISRISTVVAVTITSNLDLADAPGNVLLPAEVAGLERDSVINVSQIVTLNKADLWEPRTRVDQARMRAVERGMALVLGLTNQ